MINVNLPETLNIYQVSKLLNKSIQTVRRRISDGTLPATKESNKQGYLFKTQDVIKFSEDHNIILNMKESKDDPVINTLKFEEIHSLLMGTINDFNNGEDVHSEEFLIIELYIANEISFKSTDNKFVDTFEYHVLSQDLRLAKLYKLKSIR